MNKHDQKYKEYIAVCNELGLESPGGGGIENSDGSRTSEFIEYLSQTELSFRIKYTLLELILASMNDAIIEDIADCDLHARFYNYVKPILNDDRYYPHIPYWISIKSEEEFPIGYLLEKYLEESMTKERG